VKSLDITNAAVLDRSMNEVIGQEEVKAFANNKMTKEGRDNLMDAVRKSSKLRRNFSSALQSYRSSGSISQGTARQLGKEIRDSGEFSKQ
jgi:hypothetical protein